MTGARALLLGTAVLIYAPLLAAGEQTSVTPAALRPAAEPEALAPLVSQAYAQWPFRRWREGRPVPPRGIPSARSAELKTPLPRPRPDEITGSVKIVPVAPLE